VCEGLIATVRYPDGGRMVYRKQDVDEFIDRHVVGAMKAPEHPSDDADIPATR